MNKSLSYLPLKLPLSILALSSTGLQADDFAELRRLQAEFNAELATLRGRVDSLESRVATLESNQFSTTTKLSGNPVFALGGNSVFGEDTVNTNGTGTTRTRLNLSTSFTGDDALQTRLSTGIGRNSNANEEFGSWGIDTNYAYGDAELFYTFPIGNQGFGYVGANLGYYYFDDEIDTRENGDNDLIDFNINLGINYKISDSVLFSSKNWYSYTGIGGFGRTQRQGVLDEDLSTFLSENYLNYQFVGGFNATTGVRYKQFDESNRDNYDSHTHSIIQEFNYGLGEGQPTIYINGVYGGTNYDNPFWNGDSMFYQANAGVRGQFPCGVLYDISGGFEWRDYDYASFGKEENVRFEASIQGSPTDGLDLSFEVGYGIQNIFSNYASFPLVDPLGWMLQFRAQQSLGDNGSIGINIEHSILEGQITNSNNEPEFERISTEVYYNYKINDDITITPAVIWVDLNGNNQSDDHFIGTIRTTFAF